MFHEASVASQQAESLSSVTLLPFSIGPYAFAMDAAQIRAVGGPELDALLSKGLPESVHHVSLHALFGEPEPSIEQVQEYIIARSGLDEQRALFIVDATNRLEHLSLDRIRPLPCVARENIAVPFFWGLGLGSSVYLLIDPERLVAWAQEDHDA